MAGKADKKGGGGVIVKKYEVIEGGHHGGAWKVAYADFVTAMMAFFLLMWLLNATTEDQRKGLADYFSPNNLLSHASSGTGQPFGGRTAFAEGALVSDLGSIQVTVGKRPQINSVEEGKEEVISEPRGFQHETEIGEKERLGAAQGDGVAALRVGPNANAPSSAGWTVIQTDGQAEGGRKPTEAEIKAEQERQEKAAFEQAAQSIRDAVRGDLALAELARQLTIDMTPEGLRIQIVDEIRLPMFATGSATPNDRARLLLQKVGPVLAKLPNRVSIDGHTDAAPFPGPGRTNWDLSAERANATRRLLVENGLVETRVRTVTGHADRDPLLPAEPLAAANRRIAIVVLKEAGRPDPKPTLVR